jgi:hypothetical protein
VRTPLAAVSPRGILVPMSADRERFGPNKNVSRRFFLLVLVAYTLLAAASLFYLSWHPSLASSTDVEAYVDYAARLRQSGFSADFGNIRTYGYPAFLAVVSYLIPAGTLSLVTAVGLLQAVLYGCAGFWTAWQLAHRERAFALIVLCGLLLNPYLVSVVVAPVSDAPSLIASVTLAGLLLRLQSIGRLAHRREQVAFLIYFEIGAAIACYALMIRPANMLLVAAWLAAAGWWWMSIKGEGRPKKIIAAAAIIIAMLLAIAVWSPQYLYNVRWYGETSIFPACPIGRLQLTFGLVSLKYETLIAHGAASALYYPNPWFDGNFPAGPYWTWYLLHPVDGILTIFFHLFSAFTVDHLFVYRYQHGLNTLVVPVLGWIITASAVLTIAAVAHGEHWKMLRHRNAPLLIYAVVIAAGSILFCMAAAVETRMALFWLAVTSILGLSGILEALRRPRAYRAGIVAVLVIGATGGAGTLWLRSLETNSLRLPSGGFARLNFPCYHVHPPH